MGLGIAVHQLLPLVLQLGPPLAGRPHVLRHLGRNGKGLMGPAQGLPGGGHGLGPQGLAMARGLVLLGAAKAYVGADLDQRGARGLGPGLLDGLGHGREIVAVGHFQHLPVVGGETGGHVLGKGQLGAALDGDAIVVIEIDEPPQAQGAGQGGGLGSHPLHQVAVRDDGIDVMIHHWQIGPIEAAGQEALGHGHAHSHGESLAQRTGGGLHARAEAVFGMARRDAAPLAEVPELLQGQVIAVEMQEGVEQGRAVSGREDEAVASGPGGVGRIEAQKAAEEHMGHGSHTQGHAGMTRVGRLHHIHRQHADGVYAKLVYLFPGLGHDLLLECDLPFETVLIPNPIRPG